jgi:hypothetical protein
MKTNFEIIMIDLLIIVKKKKQNSNYFAKEFFYLSFKYRYILFIFSLIRSNYINTD